MPEDLRLYQIGPSSNSMKARIALSYKDLPYEKVSVDPQDRSEIVRMSGQPLTPVLLHAGRVIFDSASILRYLEANFLKTPRLFSEDRDEMKEIERWEGFARRELAEPVRMVVGIYRSGRMDESGLRRAASLLEERTAEIEERLAKGPWLVGDRLTAADVTAAPVVWFAALPEEAAAQLPMGKELFESYRLGAGREATRGWAARVMAYDR